MQASPKGHSKIGVLVVALLLTCYFADWTDDYRSYWVSSQYSAIQSANGIKPPVSGGGSSMNSSVMLAALASRNGNDPKPSALESVFGSPLGSPQSREGSAGANSSGRDSAFGRREDTQNGFDAGSVNRRLGTGSGLGASGLGGSVTGLSSPQGLSGLSPYQ